MTLSEQAIKDIVFKLIKGEDYRIEVVGIIDAEFLQYTVDFFKRVIDAKLKNKNIEDDWYKKELLNNNLPSEEIIIHSGLNKKTISNMYRSATREIVLEASNEHYDQLYTDIKRLTEVEDDLNISLTIKFQNVSVELTISESLIVINTLAVKRAALRGGAWSTAGKRVEKILMITLCKLFEVPEENFRVIQKSNKANLKKDEFEREIDFYLINDKTENKCEVKLMGQGNPESADVIHARESNVFVADTLSELNKKQFNKANVEWVELRVEDGYKRFAEVLKRLNIPYKKISKITDNKIHKIIMDSIGYKPDNR